MPKGPSNWKKELPGDRKPKTHKVKHTHETQRQSLILICVHDKCSDSSSAAMARPLQFLFVFFYSITTPTSVLFPLNPETYADVIIVP